MYMHTTVVCMYKSNLIISVLYSTLFALSVLDFFLSQDPRFYVNIFILNRAEQMVFL